VYGRDGEGDGERRLGRDTAGDANDAAGDGRIAEDAPAGEGRDIPGEVSDIPVYSKKP